MSRPSPSYTVVKDFAVPLTALLWTVFAWFREKWRNVLIVQEDIKMFSVVNRVSELQGTAATTFALQVVITNDSPRANIVIAKYRIKPPWNDAEIEPLDDPEESSPSRNRYTVYGSYIDFPRDSVINHRRYQQGKLQPGDSIRGMFVAKGVQPIPADLRSRTNEGIEIEFTVTDTKGKHYTQKAVLFPEVIPTTKAEA